MAIQPRHRCDFADESTRGSKTWIEIVDRLGEYPGWTITGGTDYPLVFRLKKASLLTSARLEFPVRPPGEYYLVSVECAAEQLPRSPPSLPRVPD